VSKSSTSKLYTQFIAFVNELDASHPRSRTRTHVTALVNTGTKLENNLIIPRCKKKTPHYFAKFNFSFNSFSGGGWGFGLIFLVNDIVCLTCTVWGLAPSLCVAHGQIFILQMCYCTHLPSGSSLRLRSACKGCPSRARLTHRPDDGGSKHL
jgi:hypothetical protein